MIVFGPSVPPVKANKEVCVVQLPAKVNRGIAHVLTFDNPSARDAWRSVVRKLKGSGGECNHNTFGLRLSCLAPFPSVSRFCPPVRGEM